MSRRSSKRKAARSRSGRTRTHSANSPFGRSLYRRPLRLEPLEDRRLLALVTVTTLEDTVDVNDGVTSLREAIFAADIVPGADTIEFAPALTTGGPAAILLTRGELAITDSLTIDGPGASLLTIDASGNDPTPDVKNGDGSRIFNVDNGNAGMLAEVSISGLRLTGGDCEYGGAVFNYENLTISHSTIRSNTATLVGGGLASFRGSLNVFQSKISNNSSEGVGGGIFGKETEIEIVDSQLTGNTGTSGGGIFSYAGGLDVVESILNDNVANGETGTGGGIHSIGQSLHVAHSTITGNLSYRGGGIYSKQSATVIGSTIANNLAAEDGGGINAHDTLQMFATTISDNVAGGNGGGLRAANGLKFENGTVARNSAGGSGGGIWGRSEAFDAPLSVVSSTISANTSADDGAGIWLSSAHAAATIAHSTLTLNEVPTSNAGGGFFVRAGQVALDHTIVAGNLASVGSDLTGLIGAGITAKYSIIGDNADSGLSATPLNGTDSNGNRIGGSNLIDARLAPLADNGGPTQTHALMSFDGFNQSPAINAGDPAALAGVGGVPAVDQRGALFTRVFGGRIDIGAYERQTLAVSSFVVDTLYDESDGDYSAGDLSLREAIGLANGSANSFSTISFAPGLVVGGPASIRLTHGELLIRNSVTIEGPGANMLAIDASGNDPTPNVNDGSGSRVFGVDDGNNSITSFVSIRGLELTGGDVATSGGAIRNVESLSVVATKIRDNHAVENGGGIYGYSVSVADSVISGNSSLNGGGIDASLVTLSQSTIRDNFAEHNGGGIRGSVIAYLSAISENHAGNDGGGIQGSVSVHQSSIRNNYAGGDGGGIQSNGLSISTVNDSTISGNSTGPTGLGGGIHSDARSLSIVGSTISGNVASRGGGIYKFGNAISIRSSTITRNLTNSSGNGGVVFASPASSMLFSTSIASSIIAGNQGSDFEVFGNSELVQSKGYNLIGIGTAAASFDQAGDQVKLLEPLLAPLANNGGFELPDGSHIFTHALLPSCPAINAGDLNAVAGEGGVPMFDQRGEPFGRVVGGRIDIGAFEYQTPTDLNLLVDTLVDESDGDFSRGDLSLREAIELANASIFEGVVDTIRFDPALTAAGPATIRLMRMEGDGTLNIRDAVSIIGPGALLLTIDASGLDATPLKKDGAGSSAFKISGPPTLIDVSMTGLTITGGDAQTAGGAIQANLVNLTLSQMVLSNNSAGARGGAVSVIGGNLVVVGSSITGNVVRNLAGLGGGVYFQDTNPANENRLKLDHNTISGNTAPAGGGGVWASVNRGTLEFDGNEVAHNSASGAASQGGGIFASVRNVSPLFVNNNIHHNSAAHGGGMSASNIGGHAVVADSNISANTAFGFGGKGGGLLIGGDAGTVAIERTEISGNVATQPNSTGGGVYGASEMLDVSTSTIANNSAGIGGGIYSRFGGTRVVDSTISGNSAGRGGGINQSGIRGLELLRTTVAGNSATQSTGGGIHSSSREMRLADSTIRENTATGSGGGVYIVSARIANISRSNIEKNSSLESGGGVFAISRLTLVDTTVAENTALLNGGGIAHQSSGLSVVGSTISGNTASDYGGGIWARSGAQFAFSTIVENSAGSAGGGAFIYSDTLQLVNAIIAKNHASVGADVTGFLSAAIEADFSIIGNNAASGLAPAIEAPDSNGNLIGVASKIIDPMLGALADNGGPSRTHAVLSGSPAINAGDPAAVAGMNGVPVHDQRGVPFTRVFGGRIDIGAVEALPAGFLAGDYSSDGKVDAMDYSLWQDSMGMHVTPATSADGNGDGVVDGLDYAVWKSNFGVTAGDLGGSEELQGFAAAAIEPVASAVNEEPPAEPGAEVRTRIANSLVRQPPALPGVKSVQRRPVADAVTRQGRAIEAWWAARSRPVHGTRSEGFARAIRAAESCDALDYALAELGQVKLAIGN